MLVDDSEIITDLLRGFLSDSERFEIVDVSTDGWEAISKSKALNPDLIIMDISMPRFNGLRAAETIKSNESAPKIVLLTLHSDEQHRKAAEQMGVDGFCDKLRLGDDLIHIISGIFPDRFN